MSGVLLILSIVSVCLAPLINKGFGIDYFSNWNLGNCDLLDVEYQHHKDSNYYENPTTARKVEETIEKRRIKECKNHRAMYGLEFSAFILDIVLGFICTLLGLIHYLEPGKPFEKYSGIIGLIIGAITTIITIIYVGFSANIFNNEIVVITTPSTDYIPILYKNKAYAHWNGEKYVYDYDKTKAEEEDSDISLVKFKDLGKIQYNYDSDYYKLYADTNSVVHKCDVTEATLFASTGQYSPSTGYFCDYIWDTSKVTNDSIDNKYLHDRWLTTIILGVFISISGIVLAIFGFLLFKSSSNSNSSPSLVPATVNN